MHLGRFHATVDDLEKYFSDAKIPDFCERCAGHLDNYAQTRDVAHLNSFKAEYAKLLQAVEVSNAELWQPYAQQIISELEIGDVIGQNLTSSIQQITSVRTFDHAGIASDLRQIAALVKKKSSHIESINLAFYDLNVEYERVVEHEAEIGVLLPREVVGETLTALTDEFNQLGKLFRAVNELTGAADYEPKVRTISSSWWQLFLELDSLQALVWVTAVERIVALFKSNLEIKKLQQELSEKRLPKKITDLIEKELDKRVSDELAQIASDIRKKHSKISDVSRLNEIEIQLKQGLRHLAMRINQGSQVEINVAVPAEPEDLPTPADGETPDVELVKKIQMQRVQIAMLRDLRNKAQIASSETMRIDKNTVLLLPYVVGDQDKPV